MNIDEELINAEYERLSKKLLESIDFSKSLLDIKYSEGAETLREYNYLEKISECAKSKEFDLKELISLREEVENNLDLINRSDVNLVKEGYKGLSDAYVFLESSAEKRAYRNGGVDSDRIIRGRAIARIKDPKAREAAIAALKAGREEVAEKEFIGDRKISQAERSIERKVEKMRKAGVKGDEDDE